MIYSDWVKGGDTEEISRRDKFVFLYVTNKGAHINLTQKNHNNNRLMF